MALGHQDRVSEAERIALPHVVDAREVGRLGDAGQSLDVALVAQDLLQLEVAVEVVLEGPLAATGDEQDVLEPGGNRLLDDVLDGGLVDDREHLLRRRLRCRQEPRAESSSGDHRLADRRLAAHAPTLDDRVRHDGPVTIAESKARMRADIRAARAARSAAERAAVADAIAVRALTLLPDEPGSVSAYLSLPTEPGTDPLIASVRAAGHAILVPRIDGRDLQWVSLSTDAVLGTGPLGIREPQGPAMDEVELPALDADVRSRARRRSDPGIAWARAAATTTAPSRRCRRMPTVARCWSSCCSTTSCSTRSRTSRTTAASMPR